MLTMCGIIRLPRHGASCPVGLGVSCSADRNVKCKINKEGIWIEKLDSNPSELIPAELRQAGEGGSCTDQPEPADGSYSERAQQVSGSYAFVAQRNDYRRS